ncbi:hypothetical protein F5887DRAFT_475437 [Amanita rubescens]|nr:hypothetical protein F5887DRAFT_475437 [Amanita rubescens]
MTGHSAHWVRAPVTLPTLYRSSAPDKCMASPLLGRNTTTARSPSYYADYTCFYNTVWYSLLSACALCQDGNWLTWPDYSLTCNKTYLMEYPDPIPSNTSIPTWAYLNVTATNGNFDPAAASSLAVAIGSNSSASLTSTSISSTSTSSSISTSHPTLDTSKVGAIAGGTIGGFVIALLVLTLLFYRHKRRNGTPVPLIERPISMRTMTWGASPGLYNSDEISPIPPTRIERTSQDEVFSDPWRPPGQSPQPLGTREIHQTGVRSIRTDSGTTWFSE